MTILDKLPKLTAEDKQRAWEQFKERHPEKAAKIERDRIGRIQFKSAGATRKR